jgi:tetratricopeptide (TPR) repeat protein
MRCGVMLLLASGSAAMSGQTQACPTVVPHTPTAADSAYLNASYGEAEQLYAQALAQSPHDVTLAAALVRTLLHEGKVAEAAAQAGAAAQQDPHSAAALTAQAEVQLRQGQPWLAQQSLDAAIAAEACFARAHLIRSRVLRIDSMYASERAEIEKAYAIDPADPEILTEWNRVVPPAHEIEGIRQSLDTAKDLDADTRQKAEASMRSMLPLLSENSQTCKVLPADPAAAIPLLASMTDGKHIDGYRIEVELPKTKAKLVLDTAASGLYISKALADENGFQHGADAPPGTVQADTVRIGPLEFHDCMVGVSNAPFAGKADGYIGADVFAQWLITLDYRNARMSLDPLPAQAGILPGDRVVAPALADYVPAYRRRHYLMLQATIDNKARQLFVLDTGMRFSAMTLDAAHAVSDIKMNFTNPMQSASGPPIQVYRDRFDFQFANLSLSHQDHVVEFDPAAIEHNTGFQIAGLLGFEMLRSLTMHLDYRDGLVKFESVDPEISVLHPRDANSAAAMQASAVDASKCPPDDSRDRSRMSTLQARVTFPLDSAHLKPGKAIWINSVTEWTDQECTLPQNGVVYGHVTASSSTKNPGSSELAVVFDHADCVGHANQPINLRLIGVIAPNGGQDTSHEVVPTEVSGGARSITTTSASTNGYDANLTLPVTIHPGVVLGVPKTRLEPQGGPGCSSRLSGANRSIQLEPGTELLFAAY